MRQQLYRTLTAELQRQLPGSSKPQTQNVALLMQALVFSPDCHQANLALQFPVPGQRKNLVQRLRRFLDNRHIGIQRHYLPLIRHLFEQWPDREVNLVMDRTDLGQAKSILLLGLAFKHRVIPLLWHILPFGSSNERRQLAMLQRIRPYLPAQRRITFYGDSEFRAVALQAYCRQQQWDWLVGVKGDTLFQQEAGPWRALQSMPLARGQRRTLTQVRLTQKAAFGPVNLFLDWTNSKEPRYFATNQPPDRHCWRRGRKRFWIEPFFRDWKSYGFDLEQSRIEDDSRLHHLLLAMALATLWLLHLGHWVRSSGRAERLMAPGRRDYSLFRLGRDYAARSVIGGWQLPILLRRSP